MRPRIIILLLLSAIEMMIGGSRANSISALPDTSPTAAATITGFPGRGDSRETSPTGGPGAAAVADYDRTDGGGKMLGLALATGKLFIPPVFERYLITVLFFYWTFQ